jgi:hypothetical protein
MFVSCKLCTNLYRANNNSQRSKQANKEKNKQQRKKSAREEKNVNIYVLYIIPRRGFKKLAVAKAIKE